jgi:hypothetical protein
MKNVLLLAAVLVTACEDSTVAGHRGLGDHGNLFVNIIPPDADHPRDVPSRPIDPDESLHVIDARPEIVDAAPDMPPPSVCSPRGARQECDIPGLLGPCATGEQMCNLTSWGDCFPVNFPRQEVCDAIDNDCDGNMNEAPLSQSGTLSRSCYTGPLGTDKNGVCHSGVSLCTGTLIQTLSGPVTIYSYGECTNQEVPSEEVCDALDNDCDASVDEGTLNPCSECGPTPVEVCDGEDNDCNGNIDENLLNLCGNCGPAPRELCDFEDNDCDGAVDEDFEDGACACDHPDYVPQVEICNGADDDCDNFIDEGPLGGPLTKLCSTDRINGEIILYDRREDGPQYVAGDCRLGISFCEPGRNQDGEMETGFFVCLQEVLPRVESCNGLDDDCDGDIDEEFSEGQVAVLMVVDVSGSMQDEELAAAFQATRDSVTQLFNQGINDICYMLAVVGDDNMSDPYLFYPADVCVPGLENPRVLPFDDMSAAVSTLRMDIRNGHINRGGNTENTLDAIGKFLTDDLVDRDQDGNPDNMTWSTDRAAAVAANMQDDWEVDLSQYEHRVVIVLGDERAQGSEWSVEQATAAMIASGGHVTVVGTVGNRASYLPILEAGGVHVNGLDGFQQAERIAEAVTAAIDEAACRRASPAADEENAADAGIQDASMPDAALAISHSPGYRLVAKGHVHSAWEAYRMCF